MGNMRRKYGLTRRFWARLAMLWSLMLVWWLVTWRLHFQVGDVTARRTVVFNRYKPLNLSLSAQNTSYEWVVVIPVVNGMYKYFQNWWAHYELLGAPMPVYVIAQVRANLLPRCLACLRFALTTLAANRI